MARRPPPHGSRHGHRPGRREGTRTDTARGGAPRSEAVRPEAVRPETARLDRSPVGPAVSDAFATEPDGSAVLTGDDAVRLELDRPAVAPDPPIPGFPAGGFTGAGVADGGRAANPESAAGQEPASVPTVPVPTVPHPTHAPPGLIDGAVGLTDHPGANRPVAPESLDRAGPACTPAQMRRFIKSRAWIPMHELRRRFAINGGEDDVMPVRLGDGRIFVGLPDREAQILGELLRSGDVGYELSLDPRSPIVIGVYPMRPVTRG